MRRLTLVALASLLVLTFARNADALRIRSGQSVAIEKGTTIDDDVIITAQDAAIAGTVNGNLLVMAQQVSIEGKVTGSVVALAQQIKCTGAIGGSFHAAGETVNLDATVERNAAIAGRRLQLGDASLIERDAFLAGDSIQTSGAVRGDLKAAATSVVLGGSVGRGARFWVERLALTDKASVAGDLIYISSAAAAIAPGAKVLGKTVHRFPKPRVRPAHRRALVRVWGGVSFVWLLLFTAALVAILPRPMREASERIRTTPLWALLTGFLVIVVSPVMVLLLGIPLLPAALIVGAMWLAVLYIAQVVAAVFVGSWIFKLFAKRDIGRPVLAGLVGVVVISVVALVPFLCVLVRIAVALFGVGGLSLVVGRAVAATHRAAPVAAPPAPGPPGS
jgi:hypothetical protein